MSFATSSVTTPSAIPAALGHDAVRATAARIGPHIRRTPVIEIDGADLGLAGVRLVLKLEFLQHAGSFKSRGAFNNMLTRAIPPVGVVAASGGNHGAAVAFAAMPPMRPPPPTATSSASSPGACSSNSRPTVAWPCSVSTWSYAWIGHAPLFSTHASLAASASA